jgi:hypothetical protein
MSIFVYVFSSSGITVETYNNNINLTKHPDIINASMKVTQNDKDTNEIVVRVFNNDGTEIDYSGISTAQILFTKPDYRTVQGNMTVRENDLYYKMGTNEIACTGKVVAQVQLLGADGARLTVGGFRFEVIQDPVTPWSVQSTSEYGILQQLVADLEAIDVVDLTNQFNAHKAESAAQIENIKGYIGYTSNDIYGIEVDIPNNTIVRLAGAVGKSAGVGFDNVKTFGGRRRCNLADDRTVLAYYGDAGYKEDGTNGQVMVEQPKFYYKRVPLILEPIQDGTGYHLRKWRDYVSDYPKAGFKVHPAFIRDGVEYDKIYYPAYEGSIYDTSAGAYLLADEQIADFNADKLSSIVGAKPASGLSQNLTIVNTRKLANNRGEGWQQIDIIAHYAEVLLMSIEYATFDEQTAIGQGVVTFADDAASNMAVNTGATSFLGNASGMAPGTNGKVSISYRGRENGWGNIWKWNDGLNIECKGIHEAYWADSNFVSDIKTEPYKPCGFTLAKTNGYISAIGYHQDCDFMYIPSETLGASNRPLNDYFYQNNEYNGFLVAHLGGSWDSGSYAGACYLRATNSSGTRYRSLGGGLLCIPQK